MRILSPGRSVLVAAALLIVGATSSVHGAETIVDEARGYTLRLPAGFAAFPDDVDFGPTVDRAFYRGDLNDDQTDILLFVDPMGGTIGRESLSRDEMPPGFAGRLESTKWKTFEVQYFVVPETANGADYLTYNVQIPLAREAIQFKLFGPAEREAELESTLAQVLAGLDGESNWSPAVAARTGKLRRLSEGWIEEEAFAGFFIGVAVGMGVAALVLFLALSRLAPKGAVLISGIVIYSAASLIPDSDLRELRGLEGTLMLIGTVGFLLGIADLFRKRKAAAQEASSPFVDLPDAPAP